jgi:hypothetical protein
MGDGPFFSENFRASLFNKELLARSISLDSTFKGQDVFLHPFIPLRRFWYQKIVQSTLLCIFLD